MMRKIQWLALAAMLAMTAWGQSKPDFSGTWKLDPLRSRFDKVQAPKESTMKIEQQGDQIHATINTKSKDNDITETFTSAAPAASSQTATAPAAQPGAGTIAWDGNHLVLQITRTTPEGSVTESRRIRVGDKGKVLTTVLTLSDKGGEHTAYGFYVRE